MSAEQPAARRELPPHIAAQLRSAGGSTDTGGQPWAGRDLAHGHTHQFPDDDGAADHGLAQALAAWRNGEADEATVVAALADTRLFVPVMAEVTHSEITQDGLVADKEADMSLVTLQAGDGRKAQPVFTSERLISAWYASTRPVAAQVRKIAIAAVKDGTELLVINPGDPVPFVVRRPALWATAQAQTWIPSYTHPDVSRAVLSAALGLDGVVGAHVRPGRGADARITRSTPSMPSTRDDRPEEVAVSLMGGGVGPELTVVLQLVPGLDRPRLNAVLAQFQGRLAADQAVADHVDSLEITLETAQI